MSHILYFRSIAGAVLLAVMAAVAPVRAAEPSALVARAIEKLGGAKKLSDIATLSISARSGHWDPQETPEPDIGNRLGGELTVHAVDGYCARPGPHDWVRFRVAPMKRTFIYSEVFADGVGYVLGEDNIVLSRQAKETNPSLHTMSASRVIANRRELHRMSPRLLLDMQDHPDRLVGACRTRRSTARRCRSSPTGPTMPNGSYCSVMMVFRRAFAPSMPTASGATAITT